MKTISVFLTFIFIQTGLGSCLKQDDSGVPPQIILLPGNEIIDTDTIISAGSTMRFRVEASGSDHPLTNFLVKTVSDSMVTVFDTSLNTHQLSWEGTFLKGSREEETWQFIIRDRVGHTGETSLRITLDTVSSYQSVTTFVDLRLGAQQNADHDPFFSIHENQSYTWDEASQNPGIQSLIDIIYYFGDDLNTISSPGANIENGIFPGNVQDWETRNTTRYMKTDLDIEDFSRIENDSIFIALYNETDAKRKAKALQTGDCYVFRIQEGRLGAFIIQEVMGESEGNVRFDIKIQEK